MKQLFYALSFLCACFTFSNYAMEKMDPITSTAYVLHIESQYKIPKKVVQKIMYYTLPPLTNKQKNELLRTIKIPYTTVDQLPKEFEVEDKEQQRTSSSKNTQTFLSNLSFCSYSIPVRYQLQITAYHPDKDFIACSYHREDVDNSIILMDIKSGAEISVLQVPGSLPFIFSPDGKKIAYTSKKRMTLETEDNSTLAKKVCTVHVSHLEDFIMIRKFLQDPNNMIDTLNFKQYLNLHKQIVSLQKGTI